MVHATHCKRYAWCSQRWLGPRQRWLGPQQCCWIHDQQTNGGENPAFVCHFLHSFHSFRSHSCDQPRTIAVERRVHRRAVLTGGDAIALESKVHAVAVVAADARPVGIARLFARTSAVDAVTWRSMSAGDSCVAPCTPHSRSARGTIHVRPHDERGFARCAVSSAVESVVTVPVNGFARALVLALPAIIPGVTPNSAVGAGWVS
jgi:hypothetical protein